MISISLSLRKQKYADCRILQLHLNTPKNLPFSKYTMKQKSPSSPNYNIFQHLNLFLIFSKPIFTTEKKKPITNNKIMRMRLKKKPQGSMKRQTRERDRCLLGRSVVDGLLKPVFVGDDIWGFPLARLKRQENGADRGI